MQPERYEAWYATRRGARWHMPAEALRLFDGLPVHGAAVAALVAGMRCLHRRRRGYQAVR